MGGWVGGWVGRWVGGGGGDHECRDEWEDGRGSNHPPTHPPTPQECRVERQARGSKEEEIGRDHTFIIQRAEWEGKNWKKKSNHPPTHPPTHHIATQPLHVPCLGPGRAPPRSAFQPSPFLPACCCGVGRRLWWWGGKRTRRGWDEDLLLLLALLAPFGGLAASCACGCMDDGSV